MKNTAAVKLGKMRSKKKAAAARVNGAKGGRPRQEKELEILTLLNGEKVHPFTLKCYRPGCRRIKRGYLTIHNSHLGGGAFYDKKGNLLADLREQDFACNEHGIVDGSAPFLHRDPK